MVRGLKGKGRELGGGVSLMDTLSWNHRNVYQSLVVVADRRRGSVLYRAVFRLVVQESQRKSVYARPFGGDFELKILCMRGFSSRFLDNQPENCCKL